MKALAKITIILLMIAFAAIVFSACDKDEDCPPEEIGMTEIEQMETFIGQDQFVLRGVYNSGNAYGFVSALPGQSGQRLTYYAGYIDDSTGDIIFVEKYHVYDVNPAGKVVRCEIIYDLE